MNMSEHLEASRIVLNEFGQFIEANASLHAFPASSLPYEKVIIKNAIMVSALEDKNETTMDFCRLAFHILATTLEDSEAQFVNHYFKVVTLGDEEEVNALDMTRWNKIRARINQEFASYEGELRQLINQVAILA